MNATWLSVTSNKIVVINRYGRNLIEGEIVYSLARTLCMEYCN